MSNHPREPADRCGESSALLRVDYPSAEGFIADFRANISHGDTVIRSGRQLEVGQTLRLLISFPGLLTALQLDGRVNWARDERAGELAYGIELFCEGGDWPRLSELVERIGAGDGALMASGMLRVLVVEDNRHLADLIRRGLESHLQRSGQGMAFAIHHAENGLLALGMAEQEQFDLLIVDILMPVMDGEELIRRLRANANYERVPVIALSASEEVESKVLAAGADLFLRKPIRLAELLRAMDRLALSIPA